MPIVHEPTFRAQCAEGLYYTNASFAIVVLLVCSIASRYSSDSRVLLKDAGPMSAGWKYFIQVKDLKRSLYTPAKLSDLQTYAVSPYSVRNWKGTLKLIKCVLVDVLLSQNYKPAAFCVVCHWHRDTVRSRYRSAPKEALQRHHLTPGRAMEARLLVSSMTTTRKCIILTMQQTRCLITLDRYISSALGRPLACQDEE